MTPTKVVIVTLIPISLLVLTLYIIWFTITYGKCSHYIFSAPTKVDIINHPDLDRNHDKIPCSNNKY